MTVVTSSALFCRHPVVGIDTEYQSLCQDLGLPEGGGREPGTVTVVTSCFHLLCFVDILWLV